MRNLWRTIPLFYKEVWIWLILYSLSYGLMLFNSGLYADDWYLEMQNPDVVQSFYTQAGFPFQGYMFNSIFSLDHSITWIRVISFVCMFASGLFLNQILKGIKEMDSCSRFLIVTLFLIAPVFKIRVALVYAVRCLFVWLFFLSLWVTHLFLRHRYLPLRILSLTLLFLSFNLNATLFFYGTVVILILYHEKITYRPSWDWMRLLTRYGDFLILPFVFAALQLAFYRPYGLFSGYNDIAIGYLLRFPMHVGLAFYSSFFVTIDRILGEATLSMIAFAFVLAWLLTKQIHEKGPRLRHPSLFLGVGAICFVLAVAPFLLAGKPPSIRHWSSGGQVLVPLGFSWMLYFGVCHILQFFRLSARVGLTVFAMIISYFVFTNIQDSLNIQRHWYKRFSIIENAAHNRTIQNGKTFLFQDQLRQWDLDGIGDLPFMLSGMFKRAFHDETRLGLPLLAFQADVTQKSFRFNAFANTAEYNPRPKDPLYVIRIEPGSLQLSPDRILRLIFYEWFRPPLFQEEIRSISHLEVSIFKPEKEEGRR